MLCLSSYFFFNKSFLGCLVVNNVFKTLSRIRKFSFSKYYLWLYFQKKFWFTSCFTANLLTVIVDRFTRILKTSDAIQALVLGISKAFYRVLLTCLLHKFRFYGVMKRCFTFQSFRSGKKFWIELKHKSSFMCVITGGIPQNFLSDILALNKQKKVK